jgi:hypothetical protein
VARRLAADQGLERVANHLAVAEARPARGEAEHAALLGDARRAGDEDAAARTGPRLDQPPHLEQPDGLVDRGHGNSEALAQVVLGADACAGRRRAGGDVRLDFARDGLGAGDARRQQTPGLDCHLRMILPPDRGSVGACGT